jgi:hypothetical protein
MEENFDVVFGLRHGWGQDSPFGLYSEDRRHHTYIVGKTGTGKTTLLKNLIIQDIEAGRGLGVLDPHGDLATELLDFIPRRRIEDVAYFDPADPDFAVGFNFFQSKDDPHLIASGIVGAIKGIWRDSWGPRLEYILYASVAALLECNNVSLLGVQRMLSDARYRAWVVKQVDDPMVRSFWQNEFENYDKRFLQEVIAPIQNKIGQLLMSPKTRNVLGQVKSKMDARFMMDNRRIFIANLSKGRLGEDKSNLLGALLVTQFHLAAMSRVDMPEEERKDFNLYVDEFQSFTSDSFASILSEARKYRLCLTLSHQYIDQLRPETRLAVFGNVGSMVTFRVGERDAEILAKEFGSTYAASSLTGLGNYEVCAKLLQRGMNTPTFFGATLPASESRCGKREKIIRRSREKYGTLLSIAEERIARWLGQKYRRL